MRSRRRSSISLERLFRGGDVLQAIGALIDSTTESEEERLEARRMLQELSNADRDSARNREIEVTKAIGKRYWMQIFVGVSAMIIGIT